MAAHGSWWCPLKTENIWTKVFRDEPFERHVSDPSTTILDSAWIQPRSAHRSSGAEMGEGVKAGSRYYAAEICQEKLCASTVFASGCERGGPPLREIPLLAIVGERSLVQQRQEFLAQHSLETYTFLTPRSAVQRTDP